MFVCVLLHDFKYVLCITKRVDQYKTNFAYILAWAPVVTSNTPGFADFQYYIGKISVLKIYIYLALPWKKYGGHLFFP